jgi:GPH family glycoside/pentoside/hexuronide:cation symporter
MSDVVTAPTLPAEHAIEKGERLGLGVIWSFTLSRVAFSIMGVMFAVYLMKYATDVLLIAPATMGILVAAARLWDGVTDPLVGYLSDRTRSRIGRRRVWLYGSALPMAIGIVMIWSPPTDLSGVYLVVWMAVALLVYETASTAYVIPHGALGMELTPHYHERTRLFGYVHMIGFIGSLLGMGALQLMTMADDKRGCS